MKKFARLVLAACFLAAAIPAGATRLVLDDFNDGDLKNAFGGNSNPWSGDPTDDSVGCEASFDGENPNGGRGQSLRLDYDIESRRQNVYVPSNYSAYRPAEVKEQFFNGFYTLLGPQDLRGYKYVALSARVEGPHGTRSFKLELKDKHGQSGVKLSGLKSKWKRFAIPLRRFREIKDWGAIKELVVVFSPESVTQKVGTVFIDDIVFTTSKGEALAEMAPEAPQITASLPASAVEIDGVLGEWNKDSFHELSARGGHLESGVVTGKGDLSARFAVAWDAYHLYLAVDVKDDSMVNDQTGADIWKEDCIEVYLDPAGDGFAWAALADFQVGLAPQTAARGMGIWAWFQDVRPSEAQVAAELRETGSGYVVEAALSWEFLGVTPEPGRELGWAVAVHDRDEDDPKAEAKLVSHFQKAEEGKFKLGKLTLH